MFRMFPYLLLKNKQPRLIIKQNNFLLTVPMTGVVLVMVDISNVVEPAAKKNSNISHVQEKQRSVVHTRSTS